MTYSIYRHPDVEYDLLDIAALLKEYAGVDVALRKLSEIEKTIINLSETPHIGSLRNEITPGLHAIPTARKGVVTFIVDDEEQTVFIVSITYAGADWLRNIPERT